MKTMILAAKDAGNAILRGVGNVKIIGDDKTALHPHTDTDLAADAAIRRVLTPCMDEKTGLLTEEAMDDAQRLTREYVFIIDPIDGTHSLLEGSRDAVVSIALARNGKIAQAVIFNPFTNELWTAQRGQGAFLNSRHLKMPECHDLSSARFLMSNTENRTGRLKPFTGRINFTVRGSIAYKCALVAAGHANGHFTVNKRSEWDVAAASLIIEEAGGVATDRKGVPLSFNNPVPVFKGIICVYPGLLKPLLELLDELGL